MKSLKLLLFSFICVNLNAQSVNVEQYNLEKQEILNLIINSKQFDSIYSFKKVYFVSNELLSVNTPLVLKRKNCRAKVFSNETIAIKKVSYIVLGSFVMDKANPVGASVQIYSSATRKNLNIYLKKEANHWVIHNHSIFEE